MSEEDIKCKILHVLELYPKLSPSMLQIGLGTACPPREWRPVLDGMVEQGLVLREEVWSETPANQSRRYTRLSLVVS